MIAANARITEVERAQEDAGLRPWRSRASALRPKQPCAMRANSPRAEGARDAALAEVKLAHEDARRAREEIERFGAAMVEGG